MSYRWAPDGFSHRPAGAFSSMVLNLPLPNLPPIFVGPSIRSFGPTETRAAGLTLRANEALETGFRRHAMPPAPAPNRRTRILQAGAFDRSAGSDDAR
jgi:hypothetical protein